MSIEEYGMQENTGHTKLYHLYFPRRTSRKARHRNTLFNGILVCSDDLLILYSIFPPHDSTVSSFLTVVIRLLNIKTKTISGSAFMYYIII
jgi:hypothetical protein